MQSSILSTIIKGVPRETNKMYFYWWTIYDFWRVKMSKTFEKSMLVDGPLNMKTIKAIVKMTKRMILTIMEWGSLCLLTLFVWQIINKIRVHVHGDVCVMLRINGGEMWDFGLFVRFTIPFSRFALNVAERKPYILRLSLSIF